MKSNKRRPHRAKGHLEWSNRMKASSSPTLTNYMSMVELMAWLVLLSGEIDQCRCDERKEFLVKSSKASTTIVSEASPKVKKYEGNSRHLGEKYKNHSLVKLHLDRQLIQQKQQEEHVWLFFQMVRDTFHPWQQLDQLFENFKLNDKTYDRIGHQTSHEGQNVHQKGQNVTFSKCDDSRNSSRPPSHSSSQPNYDVISILGHIENGHLDLLLKAGEMFNVPITIVSRELDELIAKQALAQGSEVEKAMHPDASSFAKSREMKFNFSWRKRRHTKQREARDLETSLTFSRQKYNSMDEIVQYLKSLEKGQDEEYSKGASGERSLKVNVIGSTYEGQSIYSVEINCYTNRSRKSPRSTHDCRQKLIVLECGIHAREWISPAVCLWIIDYFSRRSSYLANQKVSFIILPIVNPDGYRYTWNGERLWRKNRSPVSSMTNDTSGSTCLGVDLNRNFDVHFGQDQYDEYHQVSRTQSINSNGKVSPCSEVYPGNSAMDQLEVKSLVNYITKLQKEGKEIVAYFSIHSYSQLWLYPYGFSSEFAPNLSQLSTLAHKAASAIRSKYGRHYKIASVNDLLYKVTGSSVDYFYMAAGVKIAFAIELPDEGKEGFLLHPRYIEPTALELLCGIEAVVEGLNIG